MKLSKDTYWKGTITELLNDREEAQRQFRESPDRVKFVTKLETVYAFLEKQKKWAYSVDELIGVLGMTRSTVKHVVKWLKTFGAVEEKLATGEKFYMFSSQTNVAESYKAELVKKYSQWRMSPEEIDKDLKRKGLENAGKNIAS